MNSTSFHQSEWWNLSLESSKIIPLPNFLLTNKKIQQNDAPLLKMGQQNQHIKKDNHTIAIQIRPSNAFRGSGISRKSPGFPGRIHQMHRWHVLKQQKKISGEANRWFSSFQIHSPESFFGKISEYHDSSFTKADPSPKTLLGISWNLFAQTHTEKKNINFTKGSQTPQPAIVVCYKCRKG